MKTISFTKMAGAGNDFLVIEAAPKIDYKKLAVKACDRTNGIGADGILVLDKSKKEDYRMRIINSDGSEAEMCGNGARCLAAYIVKTKKPSKKSFSIETMAGTILAEAKDEVAEVRLSEPRDYRPEVEVDVHGKRMRLPYIDTGVPHTIVFVDGLENINVGEIGRTIRFHDVFAPRGTNVDFVEEISKDFVALRTYERGVESETKACGTGAVATAIVAYLKSNPNADDTKKAKVKVKTASGEILEITFDVAAGRVKNVWLKGSAKFIAKGEYYF